uniref:Metalloendopeptidase n=1 Tax=Strongyloides venezuelensis TaxID=75913 RepID=A0A0K0FTL7_STRVS
MKSSYLLLNLLTYFLGHTSCKWDSVVDNELHDNLKEGSNVETIIHKNKANNSSTVTSLHPDLGHKRNKRAIVPNSVHKWPKTIHYTVVPPVNSTVIDRALKSIMMQTCLKFVKVSNLNGPGLRYIRGKECTSLLGKRINNGPQNIIIHKKCEMISLVQHETFHALGVEHEMGRRDRNSFLVLRPRNAIPGFLQIVGFGPSHRTYNIRYDFGSVMHYDPFAATKNGKMTLFPRNHHYLKTIGQLHGANFNDYKLINFHYCNDTCRTKLNCLNGAYTNPKNCEYCKCPSFFTGRLCGKLISSQQGCPKRMLHATASRKQLFIYGIKSCTVRIVAPQNLKIKLIIVNSVFSRSDICRPYIGLEVKFLKDLSVTGARFCGKDRNKVITSVGNSVIIHYGSFRSKNKVRILYKAV